MVRYRKQIIADGKSGNLQEFYPVNSSDWYLEDYTPADEEWVLPANLHRPVPEECRDGFVNDVVILAACGSIIILLIIGIIFILGCFKAQK